MSSMSIADWLGFIGVFLILLAYFLNVTDKIKSSSLLFLLLNFIGAGLACLASVFINYMPFIILEGTWTSISFVMLVKYLNNKLLNKQMFT